MRSVIPVTPGSTLYIYVGGYGGIGTTSAIFGGGGDGLGEGGGGGGGTDIRTSDGGLDGLTSSSWSTRLVVAGGGGQSWHWSYFQATNGGPGLGGGLTGGAGCNLAPCGGHIAPGGTQTAGGVANDGCPSGGFYAGGGGNANCGPGGGGWYGGAGGYYEGGGGSSYTAPAGTNLINTQGDSRCVYNGVMWVTPL